MVVLFICAALAVDITQKSLTRQTLHDTLDTAAHAGAYALPGDGVGAKAAALAMAKANDPSRRPPGRPVVRGRLHRRCSRR